MIDFFYLSLMLLFYYIHFAIFRYFINDLGIRHHEGRGSAANPKSIRFDSLGYLIESNCERIYLQNLVPHDAGALQIFPEAQ